MISVLLTVTCNSLVDDARLQAILTRKDHCATKKTIEPFNSYEAEIVLYKPWRPTFFFILNHHKCLIQLFLIYLNTHVMGPRPLEIVLLLPCGVRL